MKQYAIGYINFFDNVLMIEFHAGDTWRDAAKAHSKGGDFFGDCSESLDEAKQEAFDQDSMFDAQLMPGEDE